MRPGDQYWIGFIWFNPSNHFERTEAKRDHRSYPSDEDAVRIYRATLLIDRSEGDEHRTHKTQKQVNNNDKHNFKVRYMMVDPYTRAHSGPG